MSPLEIWNPDSSEESSLQSSRMRVGSIAVTRRFEGAAGAFGPGGRDRVGDGGMGVCARLVEVAVSDGADGALEPLPGAEIDQGELLEPLR
jgi:hypothetical protein